MTSQFKILYLLSSVVLAASILLSPLSTMLELAPLDIVPADGYWIILAMIVISAFSVMDSILSSSFTTIWERLFWIAIPLCGIAWVLFVQTTLYLIASLYFIHAGRSALHLWIGTKDWWLWPAWIRDCAVASILFLWLSEVSM